MRVEKLVPYPNGAPGFYFVRLRYAPGVEALFAAERAARQVLQESVVVIDVQVVKLRHSFLESESQEQAIALVFDRDTYTLAKTFDTNPFILELTFPAPRTLHGLALIVGSVNARITVKAYATPEAQPSNISSRGGARRRNLELSFDFPEALQAQRLYIEILDPYSPEQARIHLWELTLR